MKTLSPSVIPDETQQSVVEENDVQRRLRAILDYWGPNGERWVDDFGTDHPGAPRCALGVLDSLTGQYEDTPEERALSAAAIEMGFTGEDTGNIPAADCNDVSFDNARKMVLRAIELAGEGA